MVSKMVIYSSNSFFFIDLSFICEIKLFDLLLEIFTKCKNIDTINSVIGFYNMLLTNISKP